MWTFDAVIDAIMKVGFPAAVATALAVGLHFWMVRFYRDVALPIVAEHVKLARCARKQLARMADSLDDLAARSGRRQPTNPE